MEKTGRVVSTERGPSFLEVDIRLSPGKMVRPGQLLFAEVKDKEYAILRVSTAREVNPYENPLASQVRDEFNMEPSRGREDLLRKYTVANSQLIEVVSVKPDGTLISHEPAIIVPAGTEVFETALDFTSKVLGFPDISSEAAISIGSAIGNDNIHITLDANKALPRHILIVGSTGTGKSYLAGLLTEKLVKIGVPHVNIDIHGELCDATIQLGGKNLIPGRDLTVKLSSLEEPEILGMIPVQNPLHVDIVSKAFIELKKTGRSFSVQDFDRVASDVTAQLGAGKSTAPIISARIQALNSISILGSGYNWINDLNTRGALINIDCRDLGHWELKTFVGAVARELINLRKKQKIRPFVLSMDEAHMFLPAGEETAASQVLSEAIRMGRHYGVGIIVSSQSPGDIDRRITKITNTRFIFGIEPSELASISGLLGDTPLDLMNNIPRLRVGTCLMAGSRETVKHSMVIQVENRTTKDSGTTPSMVL